MKFKQTTVTEFSQDPAGTHQERPSLVEVIKTVGLHNITHQGEKVSIITDKNPETGKNSYTVVFPDSNKLNTDDPVEAISFSKQQLGQFEDYEPIVKTTAQPNPIPETVTSNRENKMSNKNKINNRIRFIDDFDESKHPRAANGQFGSGGSTGNKAANQKKPASESKVSPKVAEKIKRLKKLSGYSSTSERERKNINNLINRLESFSNEGNSGKLSEAIGEADQWL